MVRSAGVLMAITSLPSPYGIGTIGDAAYKFADFLSMAKQNYWQILPIGPTSYGDSPYQSFSTFAGNPYMIDLDTLRKEKLLKKEEYEKLDWSDTEDRVNYEKIYNNRFKVLRIAFERFKALPKEKKADFDSFLENNKKWINNYALYMSVKSYFDMKSWTDWEDEDIKFRKPEAVKKYSQLLADDILFWEFIQYKFFEQWMKFKGYVNGLGIELIGDIPIYVAMDSADTWANPEVFLLDERKNPVCVAGCPPDYFSATGQLWGNPIYNWSYLESTDYDWWFDRIRTVSALFDVTRIDHFRAFDSYYAIPYPAENAINGKWEEGPGIKFFEKMKKEIGDINIIAEDLGTLTPGVKQLLKDSGYPGMKVFEFAFDSGESNDYLPHNYTKNCVVYIGTHDNDTLMGWYDKAIDKDKEFIVSYCKLDEQEGYNWGVIRTAYESISNCAIIQMQDFLALGSEARMNIPSTTGGNWAWRLNAKALTNALAQKIADMTMAYGRCTEDKMTDKNNVIEKLSNIARSEYCKELKELSHSEIHNIIGKAVMGEISENWAKSKIDHSNRRRAYYFSAEFLMGRMVYNNLYCLGLLDVYKNALKKKGINITELEDIEDAALGNGGLGRLAACFLDSAATHEVPLDGYGIRYKYGLFKQQIVDGRQVEVADDWQRFGDPWCIRREEDAVKVSFAGQTILAVPYDMAIIGYGTDNINTLRLWQSEAVNEFGFVQFNNGDYAGSVAEKNAAENISKVLYPNDNSYEGKVLRLKQQYFFCSASLQDIIKRYKKKYGNDFSKFSEHCAIQLNDTHPVVSIPELIRLLQLEGVDFEYALEIAKNTFAYTNHTVMSEALEKWNIDLMERTIPDVYHIIDRINHKLEDELRARGYDRPDENGRVKIANMRILDSGLVHMARLAIYASKYVNGVARIHTEILKNDVLADWYEIYPERFQNKTNGITQRRWMGLANPELSAYVTSLIGDGWVKELDELKKLNDKIDTRTAKKFNSIKDTKKKQLADYIEKHEGIKLDPSFIFDVQVKRLHEYKRQLLNAFSIVDIYFRLKDGTLTDFQPTAFIFGAKAAPGYARAKAIIKYINEIANKINNDPDVADKLKVVFISNYNVSYAEKIVVATDVSEQISTAGTEASGTGNMKFMLNGTVTLGTYDGANVEIVEQAGEENNYIFGARVEELAQIRDSYNPKEIYENNPQIKRVLNTLIDGTFSDGGATGEGSFAELFNSIINGASWHRADHYYLLRDLPDYVETKLRVNKDYQDRVAFAKKCLYNTANSGMFSSDRTIKQYAKELWKV